MTITEPPATAQRAITPALLLTLALLSAVAPFATDLYLPAFPAMVSDLQTSATAVQLTLTAFLLGLALGQLAFGPLSDRFGRVIPLIVGSAVCVAAGIVAVLAPTVGVLIGARFGQGFAGAAGMVIGRAIISDLASGKAAARAFSLMMIVGGVAPVIAPLVGGFLVGPLGWRGTLGVVLALSVAMLLAVLLVIRETHTAQRRAELRAQHAVAGSPLRDLGSRAFLGNTAALCFSFAAMMAYISASPFIYQTMMGVSTNVYGAMFGVNALGLLAVSALSARLTARFEVGRLAAIGAGLILLSAIAVLLLAASGAPAGWLAAPLFTLVASMGLVFGNATALALAAVPRAAGSASAVLGAGQFLLAAAVSPLVSIAGENTAVPAGIVMVATATLGCLGLLIARGTATPEGRPVMTTAVSTAAVATTRAPRYGKQLVAHLGRRSVGQWDEATGAGTLDLTAPDATGTAHITFTATPEKLLIEITAADLDRYEDVVGRHLVRFGERDGLTVDWIHADGTPGTSQG